MPTAWLVTDSDHSNASTLADAGGDGGAPRQACELRVWMPAKDALIVEVRRSARASGVWGSEGVGSCVGLAK